MKLRVREVKLFAKVIKQAAKHRNESRQPVRPGDLNHTANNYIKHKLFNVQLLFYSLS